MCIYIYLYLYTYITRISGNCLVFEFPSFFPPEFVQIRAVKLHEVQALKQYQSKRPRSAKALAPKFLDPLRLVIPSTLQTGGCFFWLFFWDQLINPSPSTTHQLDQILAGWGAWIGIFALVHDKSGWEKEVMAITEKVMKPLEGYIEKNTATWKWLAFLNNCQCSEVQFKLSSDPLVPK